MHLNNNNLIRDTQHGFMSKRSCLTNLLEFFEYISDYIDTLLYQYNPYLDFQKACDKVPHKRLLLKIQSMGWVYRVKFIIG